MATDDGRTDGADADRKHAPPTPKSGGDAHADELHAAFVGATLVFAAAGNSNAGAASRGSSGRSALVAKLQQRQAACGRGRRRRLGRLGRARPQPRTRTRTRRPASTSATTSAVRIDSVIGSGSFSVRLSGPRSRPAEPKQLARKLGDSGGDGRCEALVRRIINVHSSRRAVKRLFKEGLDAKQLELQRHEVVIMKDLCDHENITKQCLYLIMDYCEMDLYDAITKRGGFSDNAVKKIFGQIVDAVIHCHSKGFFHRDLKPENCLIVSSSSAPNDYKIKLTDFGLATVDTWSTEMGCGSVRYMAPECFDPNYISTNPNVKQPKDKKPALNPFSSRNGYPPASSDVWSLGVILVNLLFAKNPWFEAHPTDPIFSTFVATNPNILRQQFNLSPHFDALLRRCFDLDPRRRCSVQDLKVLVETMPRFVGGSVPGLIVPLGPGREMAKSGKQKGETTATLTDEEKMEEFNRKYFKEQVPGLLLPPGKEIPLHFDAEQLKLVTPAHRNLSNKPASRTSSQVSATLVGSSLEKHSSSDKNKPQHHNHSQPTKPIEQSNQGQLNDTKANQPGSYHHAPPPPHRPQSPMTPSAHPYQTSPPAATPASESSLTRKLSLKAFQPKTQVSAANATPLQAAPTAPSQSNFSSSNAPSGFDTVGGKRHPLRLSKSITGIKKLFGDGGGGAGGSEYSFSEYGGGSRRGESSRGSGQVGQIHRSNTGFFKKGGFNVDESGGDAFFKVGKEKSEEEELSRRGSLNSLAWTAGGKKQKMDRPLHGPGSVKVIGARSVLSHSESDPSLRTSAALQNRTSFDSSKWGNGPAPLVHHNRFSSASTTSSAVSSSSSGTHTLQGAKPYHLQQPYYHQPASSTTASAGGQQQQQQQQQQLHQILYQQPYQQATPPITPDRAAPAAATATVTSSTSSTTTIKPFAGTSSPPPASPGRAQGNYYRQDRHGQGGVGRYPGGIPTSSTTSQAKKPDYRT
ncbi:hypothetical protein BDR26DRAFT_849815 [Obelidium mucronatum]|nr:hypothetical protein BDR26DRAFT_849815 [Obelidium mucronatum]